MKYCADCDEQEPEFSGAQCKRCQRFICGGCLAMDAPNGVKGPVCGDCIGHMDLRPDDAVSNEDVNKTLQEARQLLKSAKLLQAVLAVQVVLTIVLIYRSWGT